MKNIIRSFSVLLIPGVLLLVLSCEQSAPAHETPSENGWDGVFTLTLSAGNLRPSFEAGITEYTATVNNRVDSITVSLTVPKGMAVSGPSGVSQTLNAPGGETEVAIGAKAEDGTSRTYTINVKRLAGAVISIGTAADFAKIGVEDGCPLAGNYCLDADITLTGWTPPGPSPEDAFTGVFDGAGHTITINSIAAPVLATEGDLYAGIFGCTKGSLNAGGQAVRTEIKNLNVTSVLDHTVNKKGASYAGSLVGRAGDYTELSGIAVSGSLRFSNDFSGDEKNTPLPVYVGGVAGALIASTLADSESDADVSGFGRAGNGNYNCVGGLVGVFDRNAVRWGLNPSVVYDAPFEGSAILRCVSSGDVTGETEGAATNVFAGGISGGAFYGMKTYYSGKIEDCRYEGSVTARGGGYWSWAGGIAGTISGDGFDSPYDNADTAGTPATGPTRIVRCYATGNITAEGPPGSWPYVGGVVAYNYYGALLSQCRFSGDVTAAGDGIYDYSGGIAGYNSQASGHNSTIEDCYSSGTVSGRINSGGVVGQNQVHAITRRCYSTSAITVSAAAEAAGNMSGLGAGGIAGFNASAMDDAVSACLALNPSISTGGFRLAHRVVGTNTGNEFTPGAGLQTNNYARNDMTITIGGTPYTPDPDADGFDGADCVAQPDQSIYTGLGWDFSTVWKMGGEGYPVLQWQE